MKKTLIPFFLILPLLFCSCAPKGAPLAFFEKDFRLVGSFSLPALSLRAECALTKEGNGRITLLSPESLCGITLYKEGDEVRFTLQGISVTTKDTRLFDFFALRNATITERRVDRETVFLVAENENGRFEVTLSSDGSPQRIVTDGGELTVESILP